MRPYLVHGSELMNSKSGRFIILSLFRGSLGKNQTQSQPSESHTKSAGNAGERLLLVALIAGYFLSTSVCAECLWKGSHRVVPWMLLSPSVIPPPALPPAVSVSERSEQSRRV